VVFLDATAVKVRDKVVQNKPAYVAVGVDADGEKHAADGYRGDGYPGVR
jgi:putative transposase